jgi:hypothetical protein
MLVLCDDYKGGSINDNWLHNDDIVIIEVNDLPELNHAVDDIKLIQGITTTHTFVEHKLAFMK